MAPLNYSHRLLKNVHVNLPPPPTSGETFLIDGDYRYYHYGCDGFDDIGWGCGYRTSQMLSSWIATQLPDRSTSEVPSIPRIQELLVSMEDKPSSFLGSRDWIGTYEACLWIEKLFDVPSKILHLKKGDKFTQVLNDVKCHFECFKSPIMIGGDIDCSSKGVVGICCGAGDPSVPTHLLVVDPHFRGVAKNTEELQGKGWVKWMHIDDFLAASFYNICLPQMKYKCSSSVV